MPFILPLAGNVVRQRLAHIILAAEMRRAAGRPVAAIDRTAEAAGKIAGRHAVVEFLAADQRADLVRHRRAGLEIRRSPARRGVAVAVGDAARHADARRPAGVVGPRNLLGEGGELAGLHLSVVIRLADVGRDLGRSGRDARRTSRRCPSAAGIAPAAGRCPGAVASDVHTVPAPHCQSLANLRGSSGMVQDIVMPAGSYSTLPSSHLAGGALDSGRKRFGCSSRITASRYAARRGCSAWKCGETPTSMRFSGEVEGSSRPMKWKPAVEPVWWQPWQVLLSRRSSKASGDRRSLQRRIVDVGEVAGLEEFDTNG